MRRAEKTAASSAVSATSPPLELASGCCPQHLLALIANADVRAWFRETFPIAYAESSEDIYTQNDVENCSRSLRLAPSLARPSPDLTRDETRRDETRLELT